MITKKKKNSGFDNSMYHKYSKWAEPIRNYTKLTLWDENRPLREIIPEVDPESNATNIVEISHTSISKEFQCGVCLGLMEDTHITIDCLHRFCKVCIETALRQQNSKCPQCRHPIPSKRSTRADTAFDDFIRKLKKGSSSPRFDEKKFDKTDVKEYQRLHEIRKKELREKSRSVAGTHVSTNDSNSNNYGHRSSSRGTSRKEKDRERSSSSSKKSITNKRSKNDTSSSSRQVMSRGTAINGTNSYIEPACTSVCYTFHPCPDEIDTNKNTIAVTDMFKSLTKPYIRAPAHAKVRDMKRFVYTKLKRISEETKTTPIATVDELEIYVLFTTIAVNRKVSTQIVLLPNDFALHMFKNRYWDQDTELLLYYGRREKVKEWANLSQLPIVDGKVA